MAVIKQTQQFRNQRIGVVRADTGEQQLWQTVGRAADNLIADVMNAAKPKAEQLGQETAEQYAQEGLLRTIDPETGRAQAFTPPASFGTIAQSAYKNTMRRRYIRTAESEIKEKASELFIKYQYDPQGPENYAVSMEDYISQMVKATDPMFAETIREVGSNYLASTKLNLMQKRAEAITATERNALINDANEFATSIQDFGNDVNSLNIALQMEEEAQWEALQAGIITEPQYRSNLMVMRRAAQQRNLPNALSYGRTVTFKDADGKVTERPLTINDITLLETAYQSMGDERVLSELPDSLRAIYEDSVSYGAVSREDFDQLRQTVSMSASNFQNQATNTVKKANSKDNLARINDGLGDATSTKDQEVIDEDIQDKAGVPEEFRNSYYRMPESLLNKNIVDVVARTSVPPRGLIQSLENLAMGMQYDDVEIQNLMQHYFRLKTYTNRDGDTQDLLYNSLSDNTRAILETVGYVTQFTSGTEDLPSIVSRVTANFQDKETLALKLKTVFKEPTGKMSSLQSYLMHHFGNDAVMVSRYQPVAEYMFANGANLQDVTDRIDAMKNSVYLDTKELVADPLYSDNIERSAYALQRTIPNPLIRDLFVLSVNNELPDGFHLGKGGPAGSKQVYLVPQDLRGTGVTDEFGTLGVMYSAFYKDELGMLIPVPAQNDKGDPLYLSFSPSAPEFAQKASKLSGAKEDAEEPSDERERIRKFEEKTGRKLDRSLGTTLEEILQNEAVEGNMGGGA